MLRVLLFVANFLTVSAQQPCCETNHDPLLWRSVVGAAVAASASPELLRDGHVYEVGVFTGNSMLHLSQQLSPPMIWGFDSFEGLPESTQEYVSAWHAGQYKDDPRHRLRHELNGGRHGWVAGFYSDSLSPAKDSQVAAKGMQAASYIDMDCDLYESSIDALDFFFRNGLIVPGTVIGYDDWWVLPCGDGNQDNIKTPLEVGEGRAHVEMALKYGATFKCVAGPCFSFEVHTTQPDVGCREWLASSAWGVLFQVVSITNNTATAATTAATTNDATHASIDNNTDIDNTASSSSRSQQQHHGQQQQQPGHGFELSEAEVLWFRASNANCVSIRRDGAVYKLKGPEEAEAAKRVELDRSLGVSGVEVSFEAPVNGTAWMPSLHVRLSLDVSQDGFHSARVRRDAANFEICYQASSGHTPPPSWPSVATYDAGAASAYGVPLCYPLLRGADLELQPVSVPFASSSSSLDWETRGGPQSGGAEESAELGGTGGGARVWAWVQEKRPPPLKRSRRLQEEEEEVERIGLVSVELAPPRLAFLSVKKEKEKELKKTNEKSGSSRNSSSSNKGEEAGALYRDADWLKSALHFGHGILELDSDEDAMLLSGGRDGKVLRLESPVWGQDWAPEVAVSINVDVSDDNQSRSSAPNTKPSSSSLGAALVRDNPYSFDLCFHAGHPLQLEPECAPLVSQDGNSLPNARLAPRVMTTMEATLQRRRRQHEQKQKQKQDNGKVMTPNEIDRGGTGSFFFVEAWLVKRSGGSSNSSSSDGKNGNSEDGSQRPPPLEMTPLVVVGRTRVLIGTDEQKDGSGGGGDTTAAKARKRQQQKEQEVQTNSSNNSNTSATATATGQNKSTKNSIYFPLATILVQGAAHFTSIEAVLESYVWATSHVVVSCWMSKAKEATDDQHQHRDDDKQEKALRRLHRNMVTMATRNDDSDDDIDAGDGDNNGNEFDAGVGGGESRPPPPPLSAASPVSTSNRRRRPRCTFKEWPSLTAFFAVPPLASPLALSPSTKEQPPQQHNGRTQEVTAAFQTMATLLGSATIGAGIIPAIAVTETVYPSSAPLSTHDGRQQQQDQQERARVTVLRQALPLADPGTGPALVSCLYQMASTLLALGRVSTPYVLKTRSDEAFFNPTHILRAVVLGTDFNDDDDDDKVYDQQHDQQHKQNQQAAAATGEARDGNRLVVCGVMLGGLGFSDHCFGGDSYLVTLTAGRIVHLLALQAHQHQHQYGEQNSNSFVLEDLIFPGPDPVTPESLLLRAFIAATPEAAAARKGSAAGGGAGVAADGDSGGIGGGGGGSGFVLALPPRPRPLEESDSRAVDAKLLLLLSSAEKEHTGEVEGKDLKNTSAATTTRHGKRGKEANGNLPPAGRRRSNSTSSTERLLLWGNEVGGGEFGRVVRRFVNVVPRRRLGAPYVVTANHLFGPVYDARGPKLPTPLSKTTATSFFTCDLNDRDDDENGEGENDEGEEEEERMVFLRSVTNAHSGSYVDGDEEAEEKLEEEWVEHAVMFLYQGGSNDFWRGASQRDIAARAFFPVVFGPDLEAKAKLFHAWSERTAREQRGDDDDDHEEGEECAEALGGSASEGGMKVFLAPLAARLAVGYFERAVGNGEWVVGSDGGGGGGDGGDDVSGRKDGVIRRGGENSGISGDGGGDGGDLSRAVAFFKSYRALLGLHSIVVEGVVGNACAGETSSSSSCAATSPPVSSLPSSKRLRKRRRKPRYMTRWEMKRLENALKSIGTCERYTC